MDSSNTNGYDESTGIIFDKTLMVSHLDERQRRILLLHIRLPQSIDRQRIMLPRILNAISQQQQQCLVWIIGLGTAAADCASGDSWRLSYREAKCGS